MNLLTIDTLAIDTKTNDIVILLETVEHEVLPIWIGNMEALAIAMKLSNRTSRRPMTHDLTATMLLGLNTKLTRVVITSLVDSIYYALLYLQKGDELIVIDARPSDSIALALRMDAPIFASEEIPLISADESNEQRRRLDERLRRIEPEGFLGE
jgi:bifunctional DNase/RNase